MIRDIDHILIARGAISDRVRSLGEEITKNLTNVGEHEIALVAVMTGSLIFVADLMRHLPMKIQIQKLANFRGKLLSYETYGSAGIDINIKFSSKN